MWLLCVDGLCINLWKKFGYKLPYQQGLTIPHELYINGSPFTPNVWSTIITGRITLHPVAAKYAPDTYRMKSRRLLHNIGIHWNRSHKPNPLSKASYNVYPAINEETIFDTHPSFIWGVPGAYECFIQKDIIGAKQDHEVWKALGHARQLDKYAITAIYTSYIDYTAHRIIDDYSKLKLLYFEVYTIYQSIRKRENKILLISDHGTLGNHTETAFIGSDEPITARTVVDIREEIERRLNV